MGYRSCYDIEKSNWYFSYVYFIPIDINTICLSIGKNGSRNIMRQHAGVSLCRIRTLCVDMSFIPIRNCQIRVFICALFFLLLFCCFCFVLLDLPVWFDFFFTMLSAVLCIIVCVQSRENKCCANERDQLVYTRNYAVYFWWVTMCKDALFKFELKRHIHSSFVP